MKISLFAGFNDLVSQIGLDKALEFIHASGFVGVELFFTSDNIPTISVAEEYLAAARAHGLDIACVSCYTPSLIDKNNPSRVDTSAVSALKECALITRAAGAKYLHHTVYSDLSKPLSLSYDDIYDASLEAAVEIAEFAKSIGVTILYEPQGFYFNGKRGFLRFFNAVSERTDNVAVCFDVGNPLWVDESPIDILNAVKDRVVHVHIKDYEVSEDSADKTLGGRGIREMPVGDGSVPIAEAIRILIDNGYDGFFSTEDSTPTEVTEKFSRVVNIINKALLKTE